VKIFRDRGEKNSLFIKTENNLTNKLSLGEVHKVKYGGQLKR
jgi:hypothetical protein